MSRSPGGAPTAAPHPVRRRKHGPWFYLRRIVLRIWSHPANRSRRLRSLGRAALWQLRKRITRRPMAIRAAGGLEILCFPESTVSSGLIYAGGWPEIGEMELVARYLRPGDGFVDGGANIGMYTLLAAARVGPKGRVEAFEPSPIAVERLRRNIEHNRLSTVHVHQAALGEAPGDARFLVGWDVSDRMAGAGDHREGAQDRESIGVPVVRLDDALPGERRYAMAKLDLEGAELLCLRGAERRLRAADPPLWQLEVTPHLLAKQGTSARELLAFLDDAGYDLAIYDRPAGRLVFPKDLPDDADNLFAVARSARVAVLDRLSS